MDDFIVSVKNVGITGSQSRTVAAWIMPEGFRDSMPLIFWGDYRSSGAVNGLWMGITRNIYFRGHYADVDAGGDVVHLEQWAHMFFVYDGARGNIYIDGELVATNVISLVTSDTPASFGLDLEETGNPLFNRPYKGVLDDVRIYNKALTAEEIRSFYAGRGMDWVDEGVEWLELHRLGPADPRRATRRPQVERPLPMKSYQEPVTVRTKDGWPATITGDFSASYTFVFRDADTLFVSLRGGRMGETETWKRGG